MSRGYIEIAADGSWSAVVGQQGRATTIDATGARYGWSRPVARVAESLSPGLYRARFSSADGLLGVTAGAQIASAANEAKRLQRLADRQNTNARTAMPGIGNNVHMERMATARLRDVQGESRALAAWLTAKAAGR